MPKRAAFCTLYELGVRRFLIYMVPETIWRHFLVDLPRHDPHTGQRI